ncbi:cupin domain-containing protein [Candidatus Woesearchaeota archaeon]|nr:cupin domain-containing protein [Candidatus Woesearchaeota archaeon]
MMPVINLKQKIKEIGGKPYSPVDVARVNDQVVRMALFDGEFHWHKHADEDELFFVFKGEIEIQYKDRDNVRLKQGQMHVVPKGVEHCPKSIKPSYVLMFEPYQVNTQGN